MKKNKKSSRFAQFMKIYAALLAVIAIVVCAIVWTKLKKYQNDYDNAKAESSTENFVGNFVNGLDYNSILQYIDEYGLNITKGINPRENHAKYFDGLITVYGADYKENDKNTAALPVYDIMAGDKRIAVISLKASGKNDSFGFHGWTIKDMAFDTDAIEYSDIDIWAPAGAKVAYNMQELSDEYIAEKNTASDDFARKLKKDGVEPEESVRYHIEYTFGSRNIAALDEKGQMLEAKVTDSVYDFRQSGINMPDELKEYVTGAMDSYIYTLYKKKSFDETSAYIEPDSDAYRMVTEVLASAAWGFIPDEVNVLEHEVTDYIPYGDDIFTCRYYGKIYKYKEGAMESGEEEFNYRIIFRKNNGRWLINYFVLTKETKE